MTTRPLVVRVHGKVKSISELSADDIRTALSPAKLEQVRSKLRIKPATAKALAKLAATSDRAAGAANFNQVLATNARLYGAPAPAKAAQPAQTSIKASWDAARAEMLERTGRA